MDIPESINTLEGFSSDELFQVFSAAFRDYARSWTPEEFKAMLERRSFVPELSFAAFDGTIPVSFTLNGIGFFGGKKTAYDTGTGTLKEYTGRGLATKVFTESIPYLQRAGMEQYLLEVLQDNTAAVSVYSKLGFEISRELDYYIKPVAELVFPDFPLPERIMLKEIGLGRQQKMEQLWDFEPSWQNSFAAVARVISVFKIIGAFLGDHLIAYGIIETNTGDVPQIAVNKAYRRRGIGSAVFKALLNYNQSGQVKFINVDHRCTTIPGFLEAHNMHLSGQQFEMIKPL